MGFSSSWIPHLIYFWWNSSVQWQGVDWSASFWLLLAFPAFDLNGLPNPHYQWTQEICSVYLKSLWRLKILWYIWTHKVLLLSYFFKLTFVPLASRCYALSNSSPKNQPRLQPPQKPNPWVWNHQLKLKPRGRESFALKERFYRCCRKESIPKPLPWISQIPFTTLTRQQPKPESGGRPQFHQSVFQTWVWFFQLLQLLKGCWHI